MQRIAMSIPPFISGDIQLRIQIDSFVKKGEMMG